MSKRYSAEFKAEVVKAILDDYRPIKEVAYTFDVPEGTFGAWVANERNLRRDRAQAAKTALSAPVTSEEVRKLKAENEILHQAFSDVVRAIADATKAIDKI